MGRIARGRLSAALLALLVATGCSSAGSARHTSGPRPARPAPTRSTSPVPPSTTAGSTSATPAPTRHRTRHPRPHRTTASRSAAEPAGVALPLRFATHDARQVITVTAPSRSSTEGSLQAWRRVAGGWRDVGPALHAWLGSDGLTRHPSETRSATPIGSFTLTRAFGRYPDPGTALPYTRTTPDDWWISEPGPDYNTRQRCSSGCSFAQGDPNEHLYYEVPYYRYALVIDYNTRNSPGGVVQGAGSAFFLHVTVGKPTQGCVSIAQDQLVRLLDWLQPARHPRILIGTT